MGRRAKRLERTRRGRHDPPEVVCGCEEVWTGACAVDVDVDVELELVEVPNEEVEAEAESSELTASVRLFETVVFLTVTVAFFVDEV